MCDKGCGSTKKSCKPSAGCCATDGSLDYHTSVQQYYGKDLTTTEDLQSCACTSAAKPDKLVLDLYKLIPQPVMDKFYGCGSPTPLGIGGLNVLDLGCGAGRDCYVASALVGPTGKVHGIDMTDEMLSVARENIPAFASKLGFSPNLNFYSGKIEDIQAVGVTDGSIHIAMSNCVINLSPNKPQVFASVYRALHNQGEFYFSDVYASVRLPENIRNDYVLVGECLGGALYIRDFLRIVKQAGFLCPRLFGINTIPTSEALQKQLEGATFESRTYRLFKVEGLDEDMEDYGEYATYLGGMREANHLPNLSGGSPVSDTYKFDANLTFTKDVPLHVDGNAAKILRSSWLSKYFKVSEPGQHKGAFTFGK